MTPSDPSDRIPVSPVEYGRPALEALRDAVSEAQRGRPLARVTVVVESNLVGLGLRRTLGARGIANVATLTPGQLARSLSGTPLASGVAHGEAVPELSDTVRRAAVRRVLSEDPEPFGPSASHPTTETAAAALHREMAQLSASGRERMAAHPDARAALGLSDRISARLAGHLDEAGLAAAAAAALGHPDVVASLGHVVWYLPGRIDPATARFLTAVLGVAPARVVVGLTGDPRADEPVLATLRAAGLALDSPDRSGGLGPVSDRTVADQTVPAMPIATASRIVSVSDPDEEVRHAVREVLGLASDGVRLDRVGVFAPCADPYLALLARHFAGAGVPAHGPSTVTVGDRIAGRTLKAALELPRRQWRRNAVLALVAGAPVRLRDQPVATHGWEFAARRAGVVQGLGDWSTKLAALSTFWREVGDDERLADTEGLTQFVSDVAGAMHELRRVRTWSDRSGAATTMLDGILGGGWPHPDWPEAEQRAGDHVREALARLAALDRVEPDAPHSSFGRAVLGELDATVDRHGDYGTGVQFGLLSQAPGQELDAVVVVGLAEGTAPAPRRGDGLLPDHVRALAEGELALRRDDVHDHHRHLLAALAAAPTGRRVLIHPRGDLRSGRTRLPSRWLLPTATALAGRPVHSSDFAGLGPPVVEVVPSFAGGLLSTAVHVDVHERDLAALATHAIAGRRVADHPAAGPVRAGLEAQAARRSPALTAFDGNLGGDDLLSPALAHGPGGVGGTASPLSATRLETWARCGFRYFLAQVLGLTDREDPERIVDLSPLDRGSLLHEILDRFISEAIESGPPAPDQPWDDRAHARLGEIADEVFSEAEARGRTGRPLHWRLERGRLRDTLDNLLRADDEFRSSEGATPIATELAFGFGDLPPVTVELADGRSVRIRGRADRVDTTDDGRVLVSDYKTGRDDRYHGLDADPVLGGTALQLGTYAHAAGLAHPGADVEAHYWSTTSGKRHGYRWTPEREDRFVEAVGIVVDGIEAGTFDAAPGGWDTWRRTHEACAHCEFDRVCPADRGDHAARRAGTPEVAVRARLASPGGGAP